TRAFGSDNDAMTTAQFETNDHNIATEYDREYVKRNPRVIYVKLKDNYMKIWFSRDLKVIILSVESRIQVSHDDSFKLNYQDNIKKIDRGYYLFDNNFSKNFITGDFYELNHLKINKIIREVLKTDDEQTEVDSKERQFKENYIEQTKRGLMKKLMG